MLSLLICQGTVHLWTLEESFLLRVRVDFETSCLCSHAGPLEVPTRSLRPPAAGFSCTFRKLRPATPLSYWLSAACEAAQPPGEVKMMEELSVTMCYDAHSVEQMSEEEILASLVDETGPTFTVRTAVALGCSEFHHCKTADNGAKYRQEPECCTAATVERSSINVVA